MKRHFIKKPVLAATDTQLTTQQLGQFADEFISQFCYEFQTEPSEIEYSAQLASESASHSDCVIFKFHDLKLKEIDVRFGEKYIDRSTKQVWFDKLKSSQGWYSGAWIVQVPINQFPSVEQVVAELSRKSSFRKYIAQEAQRKQSWPSSRAWRNTDLYEDETMWQRYLAQPENSVNQEFEIFPEPSIQGGVGAVFIHDQSSQGNEAIQIDFSEWCDAEIEMAASSKSAAEYEDKYRKYINDLINTNWS